MEKQNSGIVVTTESVGLCCVRGARTKPVADYQNKLVRNRQTKHLG